RPAPPAARRPIPGSRCCRTPAAAAPPTRPRRPGSGWRGCADTGLPLGGRGPRQQGPSSAWSAAALGGLLGRRLFEAQPQPLEQAAVPVGVRVVGGEQLLAVKNAVGAGQE